MKLCTTIIGSLAICAEASMLKKPTPAVMKLRGGLGSLDPTQVATVGSYLSAVNAGVMSLAPEKALEMYGVSNPSPVLSQMAEWAGGMLMMIALTSILALGGMDFTQALAWGAVPSTIQNIQGVLKGTAAKLGFGTAAQYMPALVSIVLNAGLFGKAGAFDSALALKVTAAWMGLNGLGAYFATEPFMKAWEGPTMSGVELAFGRFFGSVMACTGVFVSSVAFLEKDTLTAIGYAWAAFLATNIDSLFISNTVEKLGADPTGGYVWAAIQAVVAASILA
jgi:hypothetical protein